MAPRSHAESDATDPSDEGPSRVGASASTPAGAAPGARPVSTRYVNVAPRSGAIVGFYAVLILAFVVIAVRPSNGLGPLAPLFLAAVLLVFLGRYTSTHYTMDSRRLGAIRLFGSRRVSFDEIRRIQLANLRDLGPVSFFGYWGWRGRMWSPLVGSFDSVHTVSNGVLVTAGRVPLFVSPRDPVSFARELSRRVRSSGGSASLEGESFPT